MVLSGVHYQTVPKQQQGPDATSLTSYSSEGAYSAIHGEQEERCIIQVAWDLAQAMSARSAALLGQLCSCPIPISCRPCPATADEPVTAFCVRFVWWQCREYCAMLRAVHYVHKL